MKNDELDAIIREIRYAGQAAWPGYGVLPSTLIDWADRLAVLLGPPREEKHEETKDDEVVARVDSQ